MDLWTDDLSDFLLGEPWTAHATPTSDAPQLLIKLAIQRKEAGIGLVVIATDLESVYLEVVSPKALLNRVKKAYFDSQETQTQDGAPTFSGVGAEGQEQLEKLVEQVMEGLRHGSAVVSMEHVSIDHTLSIHLPANSFTLSFTTDSLESLSASCLSKHLLVPLLGVSNSLLRLLVTSSTEDSIVSSEVDNSAKIERITDGRALKGFFSTGGASLVQRWAQRYKGTRENNIVPLQLRTTATSSRPVTPSRASKRTRDSSPVPPVPKLSIAQQIIRGGNSIAIGEKVSWEDTQQEGEGPRSSYADAPKSSSAASVAIEGKGKATRKGVGKAGKQVMKEVELSEDEREITTEEEDEEGNEHNFPTSAQPSSSARKLNAQDLDMEAMTPSPVNDGPESSAELLPTAELQSSPIPEASQDIPDPTPISEPKKKKKLPGKEEKKDTAKEQSDILETRRLAAEKAKTATAVKKPKRKL